MLNRLALGCPCGLFVRGVDIVTAWDLIYQHRQAFLLTEDDCMRRCKELFDEAEQVVTT